MSSTFLYGENVQVNGIRMHYLRYGGEGLPLILIPGITSPAITWGFVAERLGQHFDTYVMDVRGRGLSSSGEAHDYGTDICAQDILALVEKLGLQEYILMGHSMGARFAIRANALDAKGLKQLILIDPPVSGPDRRAYPSKWPWYEDSIRQSISGMSAEDMKAFCPTWSEEQLRLRAEWLHSCYLPAIQQAFEEFHSIDIHQYIPAIQVPTLLMVAGKGGVILPEDEQEIQKLSPAIQVQHVQNAGHMIPWDDLEDFFAVLGQFFNKKF
ncbi:alpha/beta fold hydrolase [Acinetobacter haemolyticus]|uniref:alpha/beta fold hydrolase n=1 Tax=Acinetobacter haemolyticus TaxID=29430 RepID=UPI0013734FA5|nr:alpha/beta hydrolase [Acinetobacter haemolyticus]NAR28602.1 alpha/beta fold hydrolase [Acinetobacter haemolyticus]NAR62398.1 alpha/beta fold hydrolase [Acinetobacter haemolyticus]